MIISVIIYLLLGFTLFYFGKKEWILYHGIYAKTGRIENRLTYYAVICISIFIIVSGIRYRVGIDCENYVYELEHGALINYRRNEWGYLGLLYVIRGVGSNRIIFLGALAALQIIPFYYALKKRRYIYAYIGLLMFVGPFYLIWMNGMRQAIAASFFVLASVYIVENDKKTPSIIAAILIVIAAQFHNSAYVLLVFLVLPVWDLFKNKYVNIAILVFCAVIGQSSIVSGYLDGLLSGLTIESDFYSDYTNRIDNFLEDDRTMSFGPRRIVILLLSIELIWFAPRMKEYFNDKFFIYAFNLFFINNCIGENLLSNVSLIFRRPFYYTQPFELICFAYLLYYFNSVYKGKTKTLLYLFTVGISCCYIILQCMADAGKVEEATLYKIYLGQSGYFY